jgi:heme exporter protein A
MTGEPVIRTVDLRKAFGTSIVLDGVCLEVPAGQTLAVLGANGAGKTTLVRIVATLSRPSRGRLWVAGFDAQREPERVRAAIGVIGHGACVYEDLTARENLRFWSTLAGRPAPAAAVAEALAAVDLDRHADERARRFSEGMRRRLALARIVLARPRILLLDEPFAGLDQQGRKWLEEHLQAFKAGGGTTLMVTHSLGTGLAVADRLAILAGGRVAFDTPRAGLGSDDIGRLYALHAEGGP